VDVTSPKYQELYEWERTLARRESEVAETSQVLAAAQIELAEGQAYQMNLNSNRGRMQREKTEADNLLAAKQLQLQDLAELNAVNKGKYLIA
jgi:hypothetical protein